MPPLIVEVMGHEASEELRTLVTRLSLRSRSQRCAVTEGSEKSLHLDQMILRLDRASSWKLGDHQIVAQRDASLAAVTPETIWKTRGRTKAWRGRL